MPVLYGAGGEPAGMGFATLQSWRAIRLHRRLFLGCAVPLFSLGAALICLLPARYMASATVEIAVPGADPLAPAGQLAADPFQDDDLPSTIAAMMQSRAVAQAVLAQLPPPAPAQPFPARMICARLATLCPRPPADPQARQQAAIDDLQKNLAVTPEPHSRILDVDVTAGSAARAQALANAVVENYQRLSLLQQTAQNGQVTGWLQDRTDTLQRRWLNAARAADRFRAQNDLPDASPGAGIPLIDQQLADAAASLEAAQSQLIDAQAAHRTGGAAALGATVPAGSPGAEMLLQLETARDQLAGEFGPNYPKLKMLDAQIDAIRRETPAGSASAPLAGPVESVATVQARVDRLTARLETLSRQDAMQGALLAQSAILQSEADNAHAAYSTFVEHAAEVADRASLLQPAVTLVSGAGLPLRPSFPDRPKLLLGMLFLSLVAGGCAALARQNLAKLGGMYALETREEIPLLATLPLLAPHDGQPLARHVLDKPYSAAALAVRGVAQSLGLLETSRAVLLTSVNAGEGRSVFAFWLASMIGQNGGRALLIQAGSGQGSGALSGQPGFSDMLFGGVDAKTVIGRDPATGIDVIPPGGLAGRALQAGDAARLHRLISELKQDYHLVILDAPPLAAAPDGYRLSEAADVSLLLCRWQHSAPAAVTSAIDGLRARGAHVAGIVVSMKRETLSLAVEATRRREQALTTPLFGA